MNDFGGSAGKKIPAPIFFCDVNNRRLRPRGKLRRRQRNADGGAATDARADTDLSVVRLDDATDDGETETAVAKDGKWMVRLKPHKVGGPYSMTIAGENSITVKNVLVGEVWICSSTTNGRPWYMRF